MGKFEKLVVLTVLLGVAAILAFSLTRKKDEVKASGPLGAVDDVLGQDKTVGSKDAPHGLPETKLVHPGVENAGTPSAASEPGKSGTSLLLNAGGERPEEVGLVPDTRHAATHDVGAPDAVQGLGLEPASDLTPRILKEASGLRPSFSNDYMVYTAAEGDTWAVLAQRFFQDGRFTRNLIQANDNLDLRPGDEILVPVFDLLEPQPGRPGVVEALAGNAPPGAATRVPEAGVKPVDAPAVKVSEYEVKAGDTLSEISLAIYGTSTRWKDIFEANRDKLQRPESLQAGMKLKIPGLDKLPSVAPKTDAKPKAAAAKGSNPKKKRVL